MIQVVRVRGDGTSIAKEATAAGATWARGGPEHIVAPDRTLIQVADLWTYLVAWSDDALAERARFVRRLGGGPGVCVIDARLVRMRGSADWGAGVTTSPWGESEQDAGGRVLSATSIGAAVGQIPNALEEFVSLVHAARCDAESAPGNLAAGVIAGDDGDSFTLTAWESAAHLDRWAYGEKSAHRSALERTGRDWTLTRSSFSRFNVSAIQGPWPQCCM